MSYGGPGAQGPVQGALGQHLAVEARGRALRVPDDVVAAARDERHLRRLQRRLARWRLLRRVR